VGDFMTELRLTAKRVTVVVLLAVLSISLAGRVTRAQEVRYRSIKAEPFRVHCRNTGYDGQVRAGR
jgi:hypothetical protein